MSQAPTDALPWLVFGASGQVGRRVLARCVEASQPVLAPGRSAGLRRPLPGVTWMPGRLPDAIAPLPAIAAVLSVGPLDLFVRWLEGWPVPASPPPLVALSSMSVISKAGARNAAECALAERMRCAEERLVAHCVRAGMAWTILRPTLLWGGGMDRTLSPLARGAGRWHVMPIARAAGLRQPVHVDDVAAAVCAALGNPRAAGQRIACGGGERLSARALFERVRASVPGPVLPVPVPAWATRALTLFAPFSAAAAKLARLHENLVADNTELTARLGILPRGFAPRAADWQAPAEP